MRKIEIFIAYAPEDVKERDLILIWLKSAVGQWIQQGQLNIWHQGLILGGQPLAEEIAKHQCSAKLFLFLVSVDFIASDFCNNPTMHKLIQRHAVGEIHIVPIILRSTLWDNTPFRELKPLPESGLPLDSWSNREEALLNIALGLRTIVESLFAQPQTEPSIRTTSQKDRANLLRGGDHSLQSNQLVLAEGECQAEDISQQIEGGLGSQVVKVSNKSTVRGVKQRILHQ